MNTIAIIGGGASGMMAAIFAAEKERKFSFWSKMIDWERKY